MFPAAVGALHAADLAAEGLQGCQDAGVHGHYGGGVAVGHSLVLAELRRRGRAVVIILRAAKELIHSGSGRSWGTRGACGSRLSWRALWIWKLCGILLLCITFFIILFIFWSKVCTDIKTSPLFPIEHRTSVENMLMTLTGSTIYCF